MGKFTTKDVTADLAKCRSESGLTQGELAKRLKVSRSLIALVETGRKKLPKARLTDVVCELNAALEVRLAWQARARKVLDEVMPFTEADARDLERRRRVAEATLSCP